MQPCTVKDCSQWAFSLAGEDCWFFHEGMRSGRLDPNSNGLPAIVVKRERGWFGEQRERAA